MSDGRLIVSLTIPGEPVPWERERAVYRNGRIAFFQSREQRAAQKELRTILRAACPRPEQSFDVEVDVVFYRATHHRVDVDNLQKHVLDSANGLLWRDDSQVVSVRAVKRTGVGRQDARTELTVRRMLYADTAAVAAALTEGATT